MGFSRQEHWSGLLCLPPGDLPNLGIELRSLTLWADSLLSEPPGKPKNFGVGNLSLLQGIFPTQESNWDLLHCRWILYQLSYQGSPNLKNTDIEVAQSCLTLRNTMDCSQPGSSVHGILQARILEGAVMPSSRASSQSRDQTHVSCLLHWQAGSLPLGPPGRT